MSTSKIVASVLVNSATHGVETFDGVMLFITHQVPRGLQVDEVVRFGAAAARQMEVVEERKEG